MGRVKKSRPEFREWVDRELAPNLPSLPLTHTAKLIIAQDILRSQQINPSKTVGLNASLAYFFYGRPAYRVSGDGPIKCTAAAPFSFIFDGKLCQRARSIYAFDTGAFSNRMYKHILLDEYDIEDFSLERDISRPEKLIIKAYGDRESYFNGNIGASALKLSDVPEYELLARSYLELLNSHGRNEPDDRVGTIEVTFSDPVLLSEGLKAVVAPHTVWRDGVRAPWLVPLADAGVSIVPYEFLPGRNPDYYFAQIEIQVKQLYRDWGDL